jgi:hypothetical protein
MESHRTESSTELASMVAQDAALQEQIKKDPVSTLQGLAQPLETDKWIYRIVVTSLGLSSILVVIGVFALKALDSKTNVPDALVAIGSASIAAMAALLAPSPRGH